LTTSCAYTKSCHLTVLVSKQLVLRHTLESAGTTIGLVGQLIAGIAIANDLTVVTRNTREFSRVPDLRVENRYD
jgi:predicted nucleic acid-binding protein